MPKETFDSLDAQPAVLYGKPDDNAAIAYPVRLERFSGTLVGIDYAHHYVHIGRHFFIDGAFSTNDNQVFDLVLNVLAHAEAPHLLIDVTGSSQYDFLLYENVSILTVGTIAQTPFNNNRFSARTSGCVATIVQGVTETVATTYTATTSAIRLRKQLLGGGSGGSARGGLTSRDSETILKTGTAYLIRAVSRAANNNLSIKCEWYENELRNL